MFYLATVFSGRRLSAGDEEGGIDDGDESCDGEVDLPGGGVSNGGGDEEDGAEAPSEDEGETDHGGEAGHEARTAGSLRRAPRSEAPKEAGALLGPGITAQHQRKKVSPHKQHKPIKRARDYRKRVVAKKAAWIESQDR